MNILFMCVANSARSQMAEGLARKLLGGIARVESAGSKPAQVNPFAIRAMAEIGIDISRHRSKSFYDLGRDFTDHLDFIVTLCAEEVCPVVSSGAKRLHWPVSDPAGHEGSEEELLSRFRIARDAISDRIKAFAQNHGEAEI